MGAIELVEKGQLTERPRMKAGDTVRVHVRVKEGDKERVQIFEGVVLGLTGAGINRSVLVRRVGAHGIGVERIFPLSAPRVEKIEVVRHGQVRRAKLYYLRNLSGKKARLRERR